MNELALFSGAGGGILGGQLMGWRTVCAVECDAYAAQVLAQRQNDRTLPPFPIWSDVCSFDGRSWRGIIDVVSGGFTCQDFSIQGRGAGIEGARSGLWKEMARIVDEVRPTYVWLENSPMLVTRGLALVLGNLTQMGYNTHWCRVSAAECGAPHKRDRIWLLAYSNSEHGQRLITQIAEAQVWQRPYERQTGSRSDGVKRWPTEPGVGQVVDGLAQRVDRIKALGNGQIPRVVASAFGILKVEVNP
ncbi:DNA cytosine methyltransferase [Pseudomonas shahriarae]|uniref:DNA cytosine methyltransferase n=1 Tax=Pseudomonas shahriarae TaxID=2745512 RepID=UPI001645A1F5|nr:DNA cytosine methyltransferase [Pseudomonas shahriarae]QXH87703.1 DNA cytosine methyltransferase [Pseudomonas shahriarae]